MVNGTCTCVFGKGVGIPAHSLPGARKAYLQKHLEKVFEHRLTQRIELDAIQASHLKAHLEGVRYIYSKHIAIAECTARWTKVYNETLELCKFCKEMTTGVCEKGRMFYDCDSCELIKHPLDSDVYINLLRSTEMLVLEIVKLCQEGMGKDGVAAEIAAKHTLLNKKIKKFEDVYEEFVGLGGSDALHASIFRVNTLPIDKWSTDILYSLADEPLAEDEDEEDEMVGQIGFEYLGNGEFASLDKKVGRMVGDIIVR